ncbi:MAG: hypothetical protein GY772_02125 [bacterium]|nr:hypothetical protein [bacterium]
MPKDAKAAEEAAKEAEQKAAEQESKRKADEAERKRKAEDEAAEEAKRAKTVKTEKEVAAKATGEEQRKEGKPVDRAVVAEPASVKLREGDRPVVSGTGLDANIGQMVVRGTGRKDKALIIISHAATNKTNPPNTFLATWQDSTKLTSKAPPGSFPYDIAPKSLVVYKAAGGTLSHMTLQKCVGLHPTCTGVLGFAPFPSPGNVPKKLEPGREGNQMSLAFEGDGKAELSTEVVELARKSSWVKVFWIMKWAEKTRQLVPHGVAITSLKQVVLPGLGELKLG